jgi:hypothetical protein
MEGLGIGLAALGVFLACAALVLAVAVERLKRPRVEITPSRFVPSEPVPWTFAAVCVFNRPGMPRAFGWLARRSAEGCGVTLEFRLAGRADLALPPVAARWSSRPEPASSPIIIPDPGANAFSVLAASASVGASAVGKEAGVIIARLFDPARAVESRRWDVAAGAKGEEVAVAVLKADGRAFAWGAESQRYPDWANPDWELERGTYEVTVHVEGSGISASRTFKLEFLSADFSTFELKPL